MRERSFPLAPMHAAPPGPWLKVDAEHAGVLRQPIGPLGEERAGITPTEQVPPGWVLETWEPDLGEGETTLCSVGGSAARADVFLSVTEDWIKAGAVVRAYQETGVGRVLLGSELLSALPLTTSSGWVTGRILSLASSGGQAWTVTLYAPPGSAVSGPGRVTVATAPTAGASGMLAAALGNLQGHTDRAEHLRGAALLGRASDGRWYALGHAPGVGSMGPRLPTLSLADPAQDYTEHAAPVGVLGRAIRNATAAPVDVVVTVYPSGTARPISQIQPGETVSVQVAGIVSSTAWPLGVFAL